jgi:hypothetical protein
MPFGLHWPEIVIIVILSLFSLSIYFTPVIIALSRHVKNINSIVLLNLFAGWTFIGWIIALVWSIRGEKQINDKNISL